MLALGFRAKILIAMLSAVSIVVVSTLIATQRGVAATYRRLYQERFLDEVEAAARVQDARLAAVRARCLELASSVRLVAAIEENDPTILYRIALDELRDVMRPPGEARPAAFFRLLSPEGVILPPTDERAGMIGAGLDVEAAIGRAFEEPERAPQPVGYVGDADTDPPRAYEVVRTKVVDPVTREHLGALLLGFPVSGGLATRSPLRSGLWIDGHLYSREIPAGLSWAIGAALDSEAETERTLLVAGVPHRLFTRPLGAGEHRVALHSMAEAVEEQSRLASRVLAIGALALLAALGASLLLARGLSGPVETLVRATSEIRRGHFETRVPARGRDELGRLAESFNEMAVGLAEKERVRGVLNLVADPAVAAELVERRATLGGEVRAVSILFCDIRGFTALVEEMSPGDVIALLNEHMSALTRVVHRHHGVIDKFVGDSLMALFGAPRSSGDDAFDAVVAGLEIVAARRALNARSTHAIEVGVGIASGTVVAGCMGSADRMNYTVLGAQVNLAARLCDKAERGEVLIDATTATRVRGRIATAKVAPLELKGFRQPIEAHRAEAGARG